MISLSWVISITIDFFDKDFNASQNSNLEKLSKSFVGLSNTIKSLGFNKTSNK